MSTLKPPTPAEIRAVRLAAGLSRREAAELVHAGYRTWQNWELAASSAEARAMPLATWDLFLLKTAAAKRRRKR